MLYFDKIVEMFEKMNHNSVNFENGNNELKKKEFEEIQKLDLSAKELTDHFNDNLKAYDEKFFKKTIADITEFQKEIVNISYSDEATKRDIKSYYMSDNKKISFFNNKTDSEINDMIAEYAQQINRLVNQLSGFDYESARHCYLENIQREDMAKGIQSLKNDDIAFKDFHNDDVAIGYIITAYLQTECNTVSAYCFGC